jgi:hypothetical protein
MFFVISLSVFIMIKQNVQAKNLLGIIISAYTLHYHQENQKVRWTKMNKAEKAIQELRSYADAFISTGVENAMFKRCLRNIEEELYNRWIPVSERLPEISVEKLNEGYQRKQVLVVTEDEPRIKMAWYDVEDWLFYDNHDMFGNNIDGVTKWKDLAEEYECI